jgi:hypothetical protein
MEREIALQSQWFLHSFISVRAPSKGALPQKLKKIWSPSTEPHANGRPTYKGMQPGSPRKIKFYSIRYWGEKPQRKLFIQMKEVSLFATVKADHLTKHTFLPFSLVKLPDGDVAGIWELCK